MSRYIFCLVMWWLIALLITVATTFVLLAVQGNRLFVFAICAAAVFALAFIDFLLRHFQKDRTDDTE